MIEFFKAFLETVKRKRVTIPKPTGVDLSPDPVDPDPLKKDKILKILNVFETGSTQTDYSSVFFYNDGPNGIKQVTLGRGFTEFGNLPKVVKGYAEAGGLYSKEFQKYVSRVGKMPSLYSDRTFVDLLKRSGSDKTMMDIQDQIFEDRYWKPALKFFNDNGFSTPLAMLVLTDSTLHSGSILAFLRARFKEVPPSKGGDEKKWISEYVRVRHDWLYSSSALLRKTTYRTQCFKDQIAANNWNLESPVNAHGIIV